MNKRKPEPPMVDGGSWLEIAMRCFPEISPGESDSVPQFCMDLAYLTEDAHACGDADFLRRSYGFIRWSMRHAVDEKLRGHIAHWFFDTILLADHAKTACLDHLDWEDVRAFSNAWGCDPSFTDVENFDALCEIWKRRWGMNRKLPDPVLPPITLEIPPEYADYVNHPLYGKGPRFTGWDPDEPPSGFWIHPPECRIPGTAIPADPERQKYASFPFTVYFDQRKVCEDCGRPFIFFAEEQRYWYEVLRFDVNSCCVRCVPCREKERVKRGKKTPVIP